MDSKYKGMTVNERLYLSGLLKEFEVAIRNKDIQDTIKILEKVELTKDNIKAILEEYGLKTD